MIFLCHDCHFCCHLFERKIKHIFFIQEYSISVWLVGAVNIFEKGGFSAAVGTDQSYKFTVFYFQADLFQNAFSTCLIIQISYL